MTTRPQHPDMLYRELGTTGEQVSAIGMGGFHLGKKFQTPEDSVRLTRAGIDAGITFLDNCWDYNEGTSEIRMGKALKDGYRDKVFLMTKIDGRINVASKPEIYGSVMGPASPRNRKALLAFDRYHGRCGRAAG